jgi:hypothetical protein
MMTYVVSEGRLFSLKASEWLVLLGSAALGGFITLLFQSTFSVHAPKSGVLL